MSDLNLSTIIDRAGGTNAVAKACGLTPGAVSRWRKDGRLPSSDVNERTNYAWVLLGMSGIDADVWDVRLIGRR